MTIACGVLCLSVSVAAGQDTAEPVVGFQMVALATGSEASLRGNSVVNNDVVWASGSQGTVLRTTDGGKSWDRMQIAAAADLDFRDIEAFDDKVAVALSAGNPAKAFRTNDGGKTWRLVYEKEHEKIFFDSMAFWNSKGQRQHGIAFSDPIDGMLFLIRTTDGGQSWTEPKFAQRPSTKQGEAGFAASGTCLTVMGPGNVWIGLGGATSKTEGQPSRARVIYSHDMGKNWRHSECCLTSSESAGIFSLVFANEKTGVAVGGDYLQPDDDSSNAAITTDGGLTWRLADERPAGYRSAVDVAFYNRQRTYITTGTNGTDYSTDDGQTWRPISDVGYHTAQFTPDGSACYLTGADGSAAKLLVESDVNMEH